ncbi:plasmid partitioning protein RepB [Profundibacterium mesophilum]|uniref:Tryptophanyl-tRNA synthetase n=1 Tax=Profundibacterium mesophilum KAUST100406-0324 TaxID=1037889 RepID=A0A921NQX6_9RHOB|nr:plasmid partitioning protein RepB [Profundibacterium mesophilum]KAF0675875.1 tryptophanyl-tRNA synthetase [Profundibacterium mesophilum KAUST100406-0324]
MARKDLLKSLMTPAVSGEGESASSNGPDANAPGSAGDARATPLPRSAKGAIGAVSQSIAELKKRALIEVPADMIDDAGLRDRLDADPAGLDALAESLRLYGQQVPVLLRHSPNVEGRYEVVYGRRRVAALRRIGQPVRAMLRDLSDADLIIAQGQENSARKELSFIEKASFARQMVEMGFTRKVIGDALHLDKTVLSRMLGIADAVPAALITAIGAAPSAGRDRWRLMSERIGDTPLPRLVELAAGETSDARFEAVLAALDPAGRKPAPARTILSGVGGAQLGQLRRTGKGRTLSIEDAALGDWIAANMEEIHRRFLKEHGE